MRLLLVLVVALLLGCSPLRAPTGCPCGEIAPEAAYAIARRGVALMVEKGLPLYVPPTVKLEPEGPGFPGLALARLDEDGIGHIHFDRVQMELMSDRLGPGAPVGVFLHELSHLSDFYEMNGDTMSNHEAELRADRRAGCGLALLNCHVTGMAGFLQSTGGGSGRSHPAARERIESLLEGYEACAAL